MVIQLYCKSVVFSLLYTRPQFDGLQIIVKLDIMYKTNLYICVTIHLSSLASLASLGHVHN